MCCAVSHAKTLAAEVAQSNDGQPAGEPSEVISMGNDELEILTCRIPELAKRLTRRKIQRLADYPLARASEWSPHPTGPIPFANSADDSDELLE